jgi:hypothetical protein
MAVYDSFAGNSTQPLSKTYVNAAQQINIGCGPNFVNTTIVTSSTSFTLPPSYTPLLSLALTAVLFSFYL